MRFFGVGCNLKSFFVLYYFSFHKTSILSYSFGVEVQYFMRTLPLRLVAKIIRKPL